MGRRIRHAPAATGTTDTSLFAGIRNQPVQAAVTAVDTKKAPRQDATIEELTKLTLHKPRNVPVALTLTGQERFQVPGDDSIHRIVFRIAWPVSYLYLDSHEGIAGCKPARIPYVTASATSVSGDWKSPSRKRVHCRVCFVFGDFRLFLLALFERRVVQQILDVEASL
jgi:hypothetical protein